MLSFPWITERNTWPTQSGVVSPIKNRTDMQTSRWSVDVYGLHCGQAVVPELNGRVHKRLVGERSKVVPCTIGLFRILD